MAKNVNFESLKIHTCKKCGKRLHDKSINLCDDCGCPICHEYFEEECFNPDCVESMSIRGVMKNEKTSNDVSIFKDDDVYCAMFGADSNSGKIGFGKTEMEALEDLRPKLTIREYTEAKVFKVKGNEL